MRLALALLAGLAGGLISTAAAAAVIDYDIDFRARNFIPAEGSTPAPVDPVFGAVSLALDPALSYVDATTGVSLNALNLALGSPMSFSYDSTIDYLQVGGSQNGVSIFPNTNDFLLTIANFAVNPTFESLIYAQTGTIVYFTSDGDLAPISLPPALLLLGSALAGLAGLGLRGRVRASPA